MRKLIAVAATTAVTIGAAVAVAAGPPSATTGAATNVADTTATLNGNVFPNQDATTYYFQYGTSADYGAQTANQGPLNGNAGKDVSADATGLAPSTTYHYRLVATNSAGPAYGSDMSFTTLAPGAKPQPGNNAVTIAAAPATLTFGRSSTISGTVTGPDHAGVKVTLEQNPFPYTGGFKPAPGADATTNNDGAYTFTVTPGSNTHYRVSAKTSPTVTSAEAPVGVRVKVTRHVSDKTPRAGTRVRFSGRVLPAHDGKRARIQRRTHSGHWKTVARATLKAAAPVNGVTRSKYHKRVRIRRSGTYRVRVSPGDGDHLRGTSRKVRIRVH